MNTDGESMAGGRSTHGRNTDVTIRTACQPNREARHLLGERVSVKSWDREPASSPWPRLRVGDVSLKDASTLLSPLGVQTKSDFS